MPIIIDMKRIRKLYTPLVALILFAAGLWKFLLLVWEKFPFNADEAIVGLMARHILAGSRPVFFYGQTYMGSLDAYLVAGGFALFGQHVWVIRFVQTILYILLVLVSIITAVKISGRRESGIVTGVLLAVPTVNVTLYTTVSLGGYNEALLIGGLLILIAFRFYDRLIQTGVDQKTMLLVFLWGFLSGIGIWANGLTLIYIFPTAIFIAYAFLFRSKTGPAWRPGFFILFPVLLGLAAGSFPYWVYGFQSGWANLFSELFGGAVSVESGGLLAVAAAHLRNFLLLGLPVLLGIRPPWEVRWLVIPLIPFVLMFWGWLGYKLLWVKRNLPEKRSQILLLPGIILVLILGFIFTPFGVDPSGRYFLPAYILLTVLTGLVVVNGKKPVLITGVILLIVFHAVATVQTALNDPPAITTQFYAPSVIDHRYDQALIDFLKDEGEQYGYTNYWVAYPLAFLSEESLIFIPRLPYHPDMRYTERDDRYAPYTGLVESASRVAYITTNHAALDEHLRDAFTEQNIQWKEKKIGDYQVFYALSKVIRPREMGLGFNQ